MAIDDYMDAKQVADELKVTVTAVHRLAQRGTLSSQWITGKRVWKREAVKRYLDDAAAQKRRRNGGGQLCLKLDGRVVPLDEVMSDLAAKRKGSV